VECGLTPKVVEHDVAFGPALATAALTDFASPTSETSSSAPDFSSRQSSRPAPTTRPCAQTLGDLNRHLSGVARGTQDEHALPRPKRGAQPQRQP